MRSVCGQLLFVLGKVGQLKVRQISKKNPFLKVERNDGGLGRGALDSHVGHGTTGGRTV